MQFSSVFLYVQHVPDVTPRLVFVCEREMISVRDSPANAALDPYWWAAAPGAPRHQAAFPTDNHRKRLPSPICSCQRGFTKTGRAHPCLDLLHWPMPHHNLFKYRIFCIWPSSPILIPRVLVDFYILHVQMHTLNNVSNLYAFIPC